MSNFISSRNANTDWFIRTGLHALGAAEQLHVFNPTPLGYYKTVAGDTLPDIAALYYGKDWRDMWVIIGDANNISTINPLTAGITLVIPAPGWRTL